MNGLIAAIRFLTRVPVPGRPTEAADLPAAIPWFPLVGALVNAVIGLTAVLAHLWWPAPVAAILAVAVGLVLTGGFHEDAVADSADALGGGHDRERVLMILKDSRIGAYGGMALWVVLSLRAALLMALLAGPGWMLVAAWAVAGAWGRWTVAPFLAVLPALGHGLAKDIAADGRRQLWPATAIAGAVTIAALLIGLPHALLAALAGILAAGAWAFYLHRRLGGQTGDLLGAGNVLTETVILLVLAA